MWCFHLTGINKRYADWSCVSVGIGFKSGTSVTIEVYHCNIYDHIFLLKEVPFEGGQFPNFLDFKNTYMLTTA